MGLQTGVERSRDLHPLLGQRARRPRALDGAVHRVLPAGRPRSNCVDFRRCVPPRASEAAARVRICRGIIRLEFRHTQIVPLRHRVGRKPVAECYTGTSLHHRINQRIGGLPILGLTTGAATILTTPTRAMAMTGNQIHGGLSMILGR